jgi:hypothetical protein
MWEWQERSAVTHFTHQIFSAFPLSRPWTGLYFSCPFEISQVHDKTWPIKW